MKPSILKPAIMAIAVILATVTGCQTASTLAKEAEGDWSGSPVRFSKKTDVDGEFTPMLRLARQGNTPGGNLELSARISVSMPVNAPIDSTGVSAISATAAGIATVRGSWIATNNDEIDLTFDYSTLVINMDPDVEFELANMWTSTDAPSVRTVSEAVKKAFVKQMTDGLTYSLQRLDDLDDIHINNDLMTTEFVGQKQTLRRSNQ